MDEEIQVLPKYAQLTAEQYATINASIVAYKNEQTGGEFERTETEYYYTPEPEQNADGFYYMEAKPEFVEAGLFDGVVLVDEIHQVTEE